MAQTSQDIDGMYDALSEAGADVAAGGETSTKIAAQAASIAAGLAGHEASPAASGSQGSGPSFSIAETDDLTALMMMSPKHFVKVLIRQQEVAVVLLDAESDKLYEEQNDIASNLQKLIGGKKRLNDDQLNDIRYNKSASDAAVRLSIDYHEKGVKIEKRQEVIARKKSLIAKLKVLVEGNRGIMKDEMDSALYQMLRSKKGGLTDEQRLQRKWLLLDDEPIAAEPVFLSAVTGISAAASVGAGAGAGAGASVSPASAAAAAASAIPTAVRITKTGEPDKRFARS